MSVSKETLAQWFDLSKHIGRHQLDEALAEMALRAIKDGMDPDGKCARQQMQAMRHAVRKHNRSLAKTANGSGRARTNGPRNRRKKDRSSDGNKTVNSTDPKRES